MPVRTMTVERQRTLAGLAKAVFDTGNRAEVIDRGVAALLAANPQLRGDSALKPGMTVFVPRVEGLRATATATKAGVAGVLDHALARANALAEFSGKGLDAAAAAAIERAKDTKAPDTVRAILAARPDFEPHVGAMQEGAAKESERIKAASAEFRATIEAVVTDLKKRLSAGDA